MADTLTLQQFLPYRCTNLAEKISVSLSRIYVEKFGITISEWRVIATLGEYSELTSKQLSRHTNMDKVRVSRAVKALHARRLLDRRACVRDSRASMLSLSPGGRELYGQLVPQALSWERALVGSLSDEERRTFFRVLAKLESSLDSLD